MITLYIKDHTYHFEMENLIRVFFPNEKIEKVYTEENDESLNQPFVYTAVSGDIYVKVCFDNYSCSKSIKSGTKDDELEMASLLYELLCGYTGKKKPWGLLTGVRPVKLFDNIQKETGEEKAKRIFLEKFKVSDDKFSLLYSVYDIEKEIKGISKPDSYSLYVSIPFCPSRCSYCSFISSSVEKTKHLIPKYMPLLCEELKETSKIAKELSLDLKTIYIGGGTPTSVDPEYLEMLFLCIKEHFPAENVLEFTVECGRPDTMSLEKMKVLKKYGVDRISVNPQTLSDEVLKKIGRKHTVNDIYEAFYLSRELGFDNINMDIIAGLEGDSKKGFEETVDGIIRLDPESVTVHTLSLKSGSSAFMKGGQVREDYSKDTGEMVEYARERLTEEGYFPYYMYRQSKMLGNLENVGYSKPLKYSYYNVYVMEETHSILSCGAGSVTKLRDPYSNDLERIFDFKYPFEYIDRFDEMLERKKKICDFYNKLNIKNRRY